MKKVYILLSVVVLSLGCRTLTPNANPGPTLEPIIEVNPTDPEPTLEPIVEVNPTDPDLPIEVQAGETFDIFIDSNPSTGYHWEVVGEMDGVEFVSRDYIADEPVKPGSGGVDVWTFKAVSSGQTQVTLGSYPPDMDAESGEPEQTITFDVIVK